MVYVLMAVCGLGLVWLLWKGIRAVERETEERVGPERFAAGFSAGAAAKLAEIQQQQFALAQLRITRSDRMLGDGEPKTFDIHLHGYRLVPEQPRDEHGKWTKAKEQA